LTEDLLRGGRPRVLCDGVRMNLGTLIAIDPGKFTGIAVFRNGVLETAFERYWSTLGEQAIDMKSLMDNIRPSSAVIELPQVYPVRSWKGDPNDLIKVAVQVGVCIASFAHYCQVKLVTPKEWKGQTPKKIDNQRTLDQLAEQERKQISKKSSHVLDAIGLGLWELRRK